MRNKIITILCLLALHHHLESAENKTFSIKKVPLEKIEMPRVPRKVPTKDLEPHDAQQSIKTIFDTISTGIANVVKWYFDTVNTAIEAVESDEKKNKRGQKTLELQEQINEQQIELDRLHHHLMPYAPPDETNDATALKLLGQEIVAYTNAVAYEKKLSEKISKIELQIKNLKLEYANYQSKKRGVLTTSAVWGGIFMAGFAAWYKTQPGTDSTKEDNQVKKWNEELRKLKKQIDEFTSKIGRAKKSLLEATGDDKRKLEDFIAKKNQELAKTSEQAKEIKQKKRLYLFRKKLEKLRHIIFQIITIGGAIGGTYKLLTYLIPAETAPQFESPTHMKKIEAELGAAKTLLEKTKGEHQEAVKKLEIQTPYSADLRKDYALYTTLKKQIKELKKNQDDVQYENINGVTKDIINLATDEDL